MVLSSRPREYRRRREKGEEETLGNPGAGMRRVRNCLLDREKRERRGRDTREPRRWDEASEKNKIQEERDSVCMKTWTVPAWKKLRKKPWTREKGEIKMTLDESCIRKRPSEKRWKSEREHEVEARKQRRKLQV